MVGNDSRRLIQANVISPPLFAKEGEVSVGVNHCTFTAASVAGTVVILDKWVRNGQFPTEAEHDGIARLGKADTTRLLAGSGRTADARTAIAEPDSNPVISAVRNMNGRN